MARIFSIYFSHDEILYSAIVSVHNTAISTEYILGNLDSALRNLLPGNKIILQPNGQLSFDAGTSRSAEQLMNNILRSLSKHLPDGKALLA